VSYLISVAAWSAKVTSDTVTSGRTPIFRSTACCTSLQMDMKKQEKSQ
jgi:hypothetical protein